MNRKLETTQQKALQYGFIDGLAELTGAIVCLVLAIYFAIQPFLPQAAFALFFLALFIIAFGIRKVMISIRQRSTYSRTGYVELKKGWQDRWLFGFAVAFTVLLLGFIAYTILLGIQTMAWLPAIVGVIFTFMYLLAAYRTKLIRLYFLSIFSLLLGVFLSLSGLGDFWGAAVLSLIISLVLFAFGLITRLAYLRQSGRYVEQADEP